MAEQGICHICTKECLKAEGGRTMDQVQGIVLVLAIMTAILIIHFWDNPKNGRRN